ncbi:MAG: site-2 protease family protein [Ruminococcaceae bacterium]|nr:site-2 protease family protein [Oscillospiraceae bacterium]
MSAFKAWLSQLQFGYVGEIAIVVLASLLCITFHECSHGFVAYKLGDPTAKRQGRLSLNPLKHIDVFGLIMMAVFKFGWAKPVPVDMRYFKNPKTGMAFVALAGPVSNLLLAYIALLFRAVVIFFFYGTAVGSIIITFLEYVALLSIGLAIFNIIPIPPLDGSKVLNAVLPNRVYYKVMRFEHLGMIVLLAIMYLGILDVPLFAARTFVTNILSRLAWFPFTVLNSIF